MPQTVVRLIVVLLFGRVVAGFAYAEDAFFYEQVVPIFQRRCIGCHNDSESKGDFSLQSASVALASGFIAAGDVDASRLYEVIVPVDGKAEMPKNADHLTEKELAVIRKWIEAGAQWPTETSLSEAAVADFEWWSLKPLHRPEVPTVSDAQDFRTPIDAFILAKLRDLGLQPSLAADRQTLIRRLYFDLIGLPPTPTEVRKFVNSTNPNAYEDLVDRLLESDHYGERWARHWLDVVHYADTHGYDKDKLRPNSWPYRDYVIRALNEDKPYSRFVQEQIAGDILWPQTLDGITATGFIAAGPWDFIGHAEVPESKIDGRIARNLDRDDMVTSTMNTFTSTTVQCARCHNHKFDPITQEHYYSLQTIFAALDRADRTYDTDPAVAAKRRDITRRQKQQEEARSFAEAKIKELGGDDLTALEERLETLEQQQSESGLEPAFGYHSALSQEQDVEKWVQIDLGGEHQIDGIEIYAAHDDFGGIGAGFGFPIRYRIELSNDADFKQVVKLIVDKTQEDVENPGTARQTFSFKGTNRGRYLRFTATKLALRKDVYIFALGEMQVITGLDNSAKGKTVTSLDSIEAPVRWQRKNLVDGYFYGKDDDEDLPEQIAATKEQRNELIERVVPENVRAQLAEATSKLKAIGEKLASLPPAGVVYAGTIHHGSGAFKGTGDSGGRPRTIHVLHRGDILQPRQLARPGRFPLSKDDSWTFALADEDSEGQRRVALAEWIVDHDNPLTWRSIVNRVWQYHFGRGIVDTPNDFGRMGAKPSHPALLDWLAVEFRDGGQSLKKLHKLIVTSTVYRQQSSHHDDQARIDSGNQYLWRMNRRRLSAEEVRDAVLHVSGRLNTEMYGPGVRLFELERPEHSPHYEYHKHDPNDPVSHRRTIYRFIVRSQPDPFMTTLDCADSSQSVAKRIETVTPLQALSLLNNKFMLAMSEHFADRVRQESAKPAKQVRAAFALATGHPPTKEQRQELVAYTKEFGLENTCRLLFNLNEFVFVD